MVEKILNIVKFVSELPREYYTISLYDDGKDIYGIDLLHNIVYYTCSQPLECGCCSHIERAQCYFDDVLDSIQYEIIVELYNNYNNYKN